jgi:ssDNA-binding Zn-finger/Zn-ribbon topoisomerase 1
MQKKRPYFRSTTAELKTLYVDNKPDKDVVDAIVHELDHRSRPGAKALAELIREDQGGGTSGSDKPRTKTKANQSATTYDEQLVSTLVEYLQGDRRVEVSYRPREYYKTTQRVLSLQRFSNYNDNWYADCWCHKSNSVRSFRLDRIERVIQLDEEVERVRPEVLDQLLTWQSKHDFRFVYADEADLIPDLIFKRASEAKQPRSVDPSPPPAKTIESARSKPTEGSAQENRGQTQSSRQTEKSNQTTEAIESSASDDGSKEPVDYGPRPIEKPSIFKMVRPIGEALDTPPKKVFPKKKDVKLTLTSEAGAIPRYREALDLLIKEMKRTGRGAVSIVLVDGQQIFLDGAKAGYEFDYSGDDEVFEGAVVNANVGSTRTEGKIVSASSKRIILTFDESFGPHIPRCVLQIDNTAMLQALEVRLGTLEDGSATGFNIDLANKVISNIDVQTNGQTPKFQTKEPLNEPQRRAIELAFSREVSFVWGPPGTGKTLTLGELARILYEEDKKVLVCSNTNQAVDQLLLKLCEVLTESHDAIQKGHIIRVGKIEHEILNERWGSFVTIEGNVERRSEELRQEKEEIEKQLKPIDEGIEAAERLLEFFSELDKTNDQIKRGEQSIAQGEREINELPQKVSEIEGRIPAEKARVDRVIQALNSELSKRDKAILKMRHRPREGILADIRNAKIDLESKLGSLEAETEEEVAKASDRVEKLKQELPSRREQLAKFQNRVIDLKGILKDESKDQLKKTIEDGNKKRAPLISKIATIDEKLNAIRQAVLDESKILGATVTKAYLSPDMFSDIDTVIIDESSMVLLPAVFHASGLAKTNVVVSGDYLQLPSIVATEQQGIFDVLGPNVFETSGIQDICENAEESDAVTLLDTQYRMEREICSLISKPFYRNRLRTGQKALQSDTPSAPSLIEDKVTIIDTSKAWPYENRDAFGSRYNLMHAVVVRNLLTYLSKSGYLASRERLGICTPYRAQSKILQSVIENQNLLGLVRASTVHRYQGDEKNTMILDIPEGLGEWYAGQFLQSDQPYESGAKLFNVAISRAKEHLVIIANLTRLDDRLPNNAILRGVINEAQRTGTVIDVEQVLELEPIEGELRRLGVELEVGSDAVRNGLFRQQDFDKVFMSDIRNAKKSVAIFSGFVTTKRVGVYADLFRQKIAEGIPVRCVTRPPHRNGSMQEDGKVALQSLDEMGCIVDTRWRIHEKIVIVDESIVWFGSLNPLSHTASTDEMMVRLEGETPALQVAAFMAIERIKDKESAAGISVRKENPSCGSEAECGARATYRTGRYGPFWECEDQCGWTENFSGRGKRKAEKKQLTDEELRALTAPECPEGHGPMRLKKSQYGPFWSCNRFPNCKEKVSIH